MTVKQSGNEEAGWGPPAAVSEYVWYYTELQCLSSASTVFVFDFYTTTLTKVIFDNLFGGKNLEPDWRVVEKEIYFSIKFMNTYEVETVL